MSSEGSFCKIRALYDERFILIYRNRTYCKPYEIILVFQWLLLDSVFTLSELNYLVIYCKNNSGDGSSTEFNHKQSLAYFSNTRTISYQDGTFEDTYGRANLVM
jgi:hypothetical protein